MISLCRNIACLVCALVVLSPSKVVGADAISPDAILAMKKLCATYEAAHSVSCKITTEQMDKDKKRTRPPIKQFFVSEKPNKFYYALPYQWGGTAVSDGKNIEYYKRKKKRYITEPAPPSIEAGLQEHLFYAVGGLTSDSFLPQLLGARPYDEVMKGISRASLAYDEQVEGVECQHIVLTKGQDTIDVWITKDKKPTLKKVTYLSNRYGSSHLYENQVIDAPVSPAKFGPAHDADAVKAKDFALDPRALIGKPAPDVTFDVHDGPAIKLSSLKGRVVVLDFWGTISEEAIPMMPFCARESQRFADRGVTFIAISEFTSEADTRDFMKSHNLSTPWLCDGQVLHGATPWLCDGQVLQDAFFADTLGTIVYIGKDGIIKGALNVTDLNPTLPYSGTNFKEQCARDLQALLAGKPVDRSRKFK
jgi:hypothetical protein